MDCPWCGLEVSIEKYGTHFDSHKNPAYDRKLIRESKNRHISRPKGVDSQMVSFARCVAEKLTALPRPGEYPSGPDLGEKGCIARLVKRRMEFEREIYDVLLGEKTLQGFFSYATQSWDIDKRKLSQMFYDCLEGLDDKEAKEIRRELGKFFARAG